MTFFDVDLAIWSLGLVLHISLLWVLMGRKRWRAYPLFTLFVAYQCIVTVTLFLVSRGGAVELYRKLFWSSEALCFLLELAVTAELFAQIWRCSSPRPQFTPSTVVYPAFFSLVLALFSAAAVGSRTMPLLDLAALRGAVFTSFLLCGCFATVTLRANALHLRRTRHAMTIGWGLTGVAILELMEDCTFFTFGWHRGITDFNRAEELIYAGIVLFWTVGMWRPETSRLPLTPSVKVEKALG